MVGRLGQRVNLNLGRILLYKDLIELLNNVLRISNALLAKSKLGCNVVGNLVRDALVDIDPGRNDGIRAFLRYRLNVHSALLPKYRGLMPTFWTLKKGEKETGVSVFLVDEGIDSGPIVVQKRVPIRTNRLEGLIRETKVVGMDAVWEAVEKVRRGRLKLNPNPDAEKSYFSFPTKDDVRAFRAAGKRLY